MNKTTHKEKAFLREWQNIWHPLLSIIKRGLLGTHVGEGFYLYLEVSWHVPDFIKSVQNKHRLFPQIQVDVLNNYVESNLIRYG